MTSLGYDVEITTKAVVRVDLRRLAEIFANFSDDQQTRFFSMVAEEMDKIGRHVLETQAIYIGKHLQGCECATERGRQFIEAIYEGLKP